MHKTDEVNCTTLMVFFLMYFSSSIDHYSTANIGDNSLLDTDLENRRILCVTAGQSFKSTKLRYYDHYVPRVRAYELNYSDRGKITPCLLYTSPSPRDRTRSRMPSSA